MTFPTIDGLRTMELGIPGDSRTFPNDCVLNGAKRATAGLLSEYLEEGEPWEHVGERMYLVDDELNPLGLIEITAVEPTTFAEVTWAFAQAEAEGYADLAEWRSTHLDYWARTGQEVSDETPVLCIYFDLVEPTDAAGYQPEGR